MPAGKGDDRTYLLKGAQVKGYERETIVFSLYERRALTKNLQNAVEDNFLVLEDTNIKCTCFHNLFLLYFWCFLFEFQVREFISFYWKQK